MPRVRRFQGEDAERIARLYRNGATAKQIAFDFATSTRVIYRVLKDEGVERRPRGGARRRTALPPQPRVREPDPITGDIIARVTWLHEVQGLSSLRIAPLVRLPYREVERVIGAGTS